MCSSPVTPKATRLQGVSVDNVGSDMGKMTAMNEILATDYGQRPEQYLADGGYAKLDDIEALAGIGIESRDRHRKLCAGAETPRCHP